ncbi:afadin-like isoform X2 [Centruroides vittatus]|uniref:afadin-like isoform X2 n=1 Tax=Centruroides vittatus TaxID=120091 RepID=UPI00350ECFD9
MDEKSYLPSIPEGNSFKRKLSKREKKEKKKREKKEKLKVSDEKKDGIAERLYSELPETSFTRSISNPEAVMRRRRQQKLEKRLQQFRQEGGTEAGGTLRIFGENLNKDVPYKTLLLSTKDTAAYVVKEILEKYGHDKEDPVQYCLVQAIVPTTSVGIDGDLQEYHSNIPGVREYILDDDDCPLAIERQHNRSKGILIFHVKRKPADYQPRKRKKKPKPSKGERDGYKYEDSLERLPYLLELNPDGSEIHGAPKKHRLYLNVTEVGSERSSSTGGQCLQKRGATPDLRQSTDYLERNSRKEDQLSIHHGGYETTFDADGNVETVSTHSREEHMSRKSDDVHSHRSVGRESTHGHGSFEKYDQRRGNDPILPAVLEFWEEGEDKFLNATITQLDPSQVQFKLAPTYTLYMAARYRASTHFRPETTPNERAHRLTALMNKVASMIHQVIQDRYRDAGSLAFWLANASELLHFLKQDRHLSAYTLDAQDMLAESVQLAFRSLVTCQQGELQTAMPAFLEDRDDVSEEEGTTADVLNVLSNAMSLLRRCRVNAALTIQLFSQLFHYINMWLFNKVVCDARPNLCTRLWGVRFKRRLGRVEAWAEKQGLELAADCHLSRIVQAAHLLQAPKSSPEDIASISSSCFKLNSLQLFTLLEKYQPVPDEPLIPRDLIENVVKVAENTADELARSDGREVKLEEDADLQLPFLLPEDGYSCDIVRGVPAGLQEFVQPLVQTGLCHLTIQTSSSGYWTIYMSDQDIGHFPPRACSPSIHSHAGDGEGSGRGSAVPPEPEVTTIRLQKSNNGIGLSIVAAGGVDQDKLGIYVKSVVKGGAADLDGRLQAGDQLLKVDGQSLVGISQEKAAELMTRTGPVVTLEVAKQGAIYHGLAALLSKPSPVMPRGPHRLSERDIPSRVMHDQNYDPRLFNVSGSRIQGSKSVPSLNSGQSVQDTNRPPSTSSRSHEVYNPAYSRTSSTTSIPKAAEFSGPIPNDSAGRSKSTNNLRQETSNDRYPYIPPVGHPPPAYSATPGPVGRPGSQPNLHHQSQQAQQLIQEERHYQNISMYQQQNSHSLSRPTPTQYSQQPQQQQQQQQHQQQQLPQQQQQHIPKIIHGSHSSLNRPDHQQMMTQSSLDRSRPLSTLVSPREQEQYVNSLGYMHNSGTSLPPPPSPHRSQSGHVGPEYRPQPQGHIQQRIPDGREYHNPPDQHFFNEAIPENVPYGDHNSRNYLPNYSHGHIQPQHVESRQRDLIRQEAKMEEMREEVRRREERNHQQSNQPWGVMRSPQSGMLPQSNRQPPPGYPGPASYNSPPGPQGPRTNTIGGPPPPPAPKPRPHSGNEKSLKQYGYNSRHDNLPENHNAYQDPSNPLTSSNSHLTSQQRPPPPAVSYRYGPSGYPPRPGENHSNIGKPPYLDPRISAAFAKQSSIIQSAQGQKQVTFDTLRSLSVSGHPSSQDKKDSSTLASPSPWEREEKEKVIYICIKIF